MYFKQYKIYSLDINCIYRLALCKNKRQMNDELIWTISVLVVHFLNISSFMCSLCGVNLCQKSDDNNNAIREIVRHDRVCKIKEMFSAGNIAGKYTS